MDETYDLIPDSYSVLSLSFSVRADKSELAVASFLPENYLSFEKQGVEKISFIVLVSFSSDLVLSVMCC